MKTISDVIAAKEKLEEDILNLVKSFEQTYGVRVSDVIIDSIQQIGGTKSTVHFVECKVEL